MSLAVIISFENDYGSGRFKQSLRRGKLGGKIAFSSAARPLIHACVRVRPSLRVMESAQHMLHESVVGVATEDVLGGGGGGGGRGG